MTRDILAWKNRDASEPPPLLRLRSSYWFIISVICIAVFTVCAIVSFREDYRRIGRLIGDIHHKDIFLYGIVSQDEEGGIGVRFSLNWSDDGLL